MLHHRAVRRGSALRHHVGSDRSERRDSRKLLRLHARFFTSHNEQVIFEGETTFGYEEWSGPLVSVSGSDITVTGADGAYLNGDGSRWWDGEGSNGGKTKPKFFYAHDLTSSTISGIYIQNSPVQVFSIDGSTYLTMEDITIDNTDGDDGEAANTDGFDIGDSTYITITGANVYNQDDCVAVNSGEVSIPSFKVRMWTLMGTRTFTFRAASALVATGCRSVPLAVGVTTP